MTIQIYKTGFRAGITAFAATVAFGLVQALQLLHMLRFPWDQILIYAGSLCIVIPFLLEMLALHYATPQDKKFWSHAALLFTVIYSVFATANYVVQLSTVIPMTLKGEQDKISLLIQTPHSLFWDFDAAGYIFMGFATLAAAPVFEKRGLQKWVRRMFIANGAVTPLIAFVYFYPGFSDTILLLGICWVLTAPLSMLLLALLFRREYQSLSMTR